MPSSIRLAVAHFAAITMLAPPLAGAVSSTPVNVVNATDIAKAQGIQQPFQATFDCNGDSGGGVSCSGDSPAIPSNQRWVIEYVSARCFIDNTSQKLSEFSIWTYTSGYGVSYYPPISDNVGAVGHSGSGINEVQLGQPVRLYANANSIIKIDATASGVSHFPGYPYCHVSLSGQAVSFP